MSRAALACVICAGAVAVAAEAGAQLPRWQCSPTGGSALDPGLAAAASDYLGRVEAIYPYQALGLVRAGERFFLLNSRDVQWSDRTRLHLLAQRLQDASGVRILRPAVDHNVAPVDRHERAEPYLTPERQALGATPGSSPPAGSFICLAAARAEREGLTRTPRGDIVLAAGQSVHLLDPQEPEVAVEVRAAPDRTLDLGDVFRRSARAGIYAGLTGQAKPAGPAVTVQPPDGTLIIRMASAGGSPAETRVEVPEWAAVSAIERPAGPRPAPAIVAAAAAPVVAPGPPAEPVDAPLVPVAKAAPEPPAIVASSSPAPTVRLAAGKATPAAQPAAGQTYEDYAKAMKTLLALRRSGAVRSVSELTYVHPAVEMIRYQPR